ncbi:hypothetical protein CYMTET_42680 [Cymbomonas tetramitiformis]|uniref:Uncharacterized protein n=1 Tax=Cymbomonas tetramitiformis TaxID=36881 RepID=A0AAE0C508_9CHLO|nr:hypothetical protein CYMTET_42680 [Cymbomonas tetramitiformis]
MSEEAVFGLLVPRLPCDIVEPQVGSTSGDWGLTTGNGGKDWNVKRVKSTNVINFSNSRIAGSEARHAFTEVLMCYQQVVEAEK